MNARNLPGPGDAETFSPAVESACQPAEMVAHHQQVANEVTK